MAIPKINLAASLLDLLHDLRLMRNSLEAQLDRIDRMEREMKALVGLCGGVSPSTEALGPVALSLDIRPRPDGSVDFAIDGGGIFSLPPRLAEVFLFVATSDKGRSHKDVLVGWRTRVEIVEFLAKQTPGKTFSSRYVNGIVYLLKKALREAGYESKLIQTHRQKGIRLAYKPSAQRPPQSWPDESSSRA